jgi:hypothetical protein
MLARTSASLTGVRSRPQILDNEILWLTVQLALIVLTHQLLLPAVVGGARLPSARYFHPSLIAAAIGHTPWLTVFAVTMVPLVAWRNRIRWEDIDPKRRTRMFVMVPVFIFSWVCGLYDFNLYFNQLHLDGRLLAAVLASACWFHPAFVCAFVLWVGVVLGQIEAPIVWGAWHWPDKRLPFDTLILFSAFLQVRAWSRPHAQLPALLFLVLTGMTYAHAAFSKAMLGPWPWSWALGNEFGNLFIGAHLNGGWLRMLPADWVLFIAEHLNAVSPALGIVTMLVEGAGLALLCHRRATTPILLAIIGMHVMILVSSGIFFWKWMLLDGALIGYVVALNRDHADRSHAKPHRVLSLIPARFAIPAAALLIIGARPAFQLVPFAWHDSPVTNYFEIRAEGVSGRRYRLDPRFFAPYDLIVQQSRFYYIVQDRVLAGTYAAMFDSALLGSLRNSSVQDIPALRERYGIRYANADASERLKDFIQRSVQNAQIRGSRHHALSWLSPPYHFRTTMAADTYTFQEKLTAVELRYQEWFYDGRRLHHITEKPSLRITLNP